MSQSPAHATGLQELAVVRDGTRTTRTTALLAVCIFAIALWQNLSAVDESPFHPDESRWISRSDYLQNLIRPTSQTWDDRYLTRGQPPMGSYVTGLGLFLQGRPLGEYGPWDFHFGNEVNVVWNVVKGNMPTAADILAARRTNAVLGALTCVVLFLVVTWLTHWIGGTIGALFFAFHPLQTYLASLAVSDTLFTLFVALSTLVAVMLAAKPNWPRAISLGVVLGMGASTKLSPLFVAVALAGLGGLFLVGNLLRSIPLVPAFVKRRRGSAGEHRRLGWMLLTLPAVTFATFVVSYPYLWPDPIGRTQALLNFRLDEIANQGQIWPGTAIGSRVEAITRTWQNLEYTYSTTDRLFSAIGDALGQHWTGFGIDVPLALAGLILLVALTLSRRLPVRQLLALAVVLTQSAIILAKLSIDFNRYYLPLVFACALGVGFLAGQATIWVQSRASHRRATLAPPSR